MSKHEKGAHQASPDPRRMLTQMHARIHI